MSNRPRLPSLDAAPRRTARRSVCTRRGGHRDNHEPRTGRTQTVLAKLERELDGEAGHAVLASTSREPWHWLHLIKALAYEAHMFEAAAMLLARFVVAEAPANNNNSVTGPFGELFQMHLSGTPATPEQRRRVVERLAGLSTRRISATRSLRALSLTPRSMSQC